MTDRPKEHATRCRTRGAGPLAALALVGALLLAAGAPPATAKPPPRPHAGPGTNHATADPFTADHTA